MMDLVQGLPPQRTGLQAGREIRRSGIHSHSEHRVSAGMPHHTDLRAGLPGQPLDQDVERRRRHEIAENLVSHLKIGARGALMIG